jgi:quercetin dioxygenase-like cupin family protein
MKPIVYWLSLMCFFIAPPLPANAANWIGPAEKTPGKFDARSLDQLLETNKPAREENIKTTPLFRNERSASVLLQVRDREPLHRHIDSDITVFMLRGKGEIRIGGLTHAVKAGDIIHIPRGVIHAYINRGAEPGAALLVYSPAPGPKDRILAPDVEAR